MGINSGDLTIDGYICDTESSYCDPAYEKLSRLQDPYGLAIQGDIAYVLGYNDDGFVVLDISDPNNPSQIAMVTHGTYLNNPRDIFVNGDYAYITTYYDRVSIYNISDPANPTYTGSYYNNSYLSDSYEIVVSGKYAYIVSVGDDRLVILDVSDPANPTFVSSLTGITDPHFVDVKGKYAYVTGYTSNNLSIIDISNPSSPTIVGSISDSTGSTVLDGALGLDVVGHFAYVASYDEDAIGIFDISSSTNPVEVGYLRDGVGGAVLNGARDIKIEGNYAYIASTLEDSIAVIDISSSTNPTHVTSIGNTVNLNNPVRLQVANGKVYTVSVVSESFSILDIPTFTAASAVIGDLNATNFTVYNDAFFNNDVYVSDGLLVDGNILSNSALSALELKITSPTTSFNGVEYYWPGADGTNGYVLKTDSNGNLSWDTNAATLQEVTDLGNMTNDSIYSLYTTPELMSLVRDETQGSQWATTTLNGARSVVVIEDIAYVLAYDDGAIAAYDLSSSTNPILLDTLTDDGGDIRLNGAEDMIIVGDYAYIYSYSEFEIVDISNPSNLRHIGSLGGFDRNNCIAYSDGIIYMGRGYINPDIYRVDVTDPTNPIQLTSLQETGSSLNIEDPTALVANGKYLYVLSNTYLNSNDYVTILDITDPNNVTQTDTLTDSSFAVTQSMELQGDVLYGVSNSSNCFWSVDVSDPTNISVLGTYCSGDYLEGAGMMDLSSGYAYVNNEFPGSEEGIAVLNISSSTNITLEAFIPEDETYFDGNGDISISDNGLLVQVDGNADTMHVFEIPRHVAPAGDFDLLGTYNFTNRGKAEFYGKVTLGTDLTINGVDYIFPIQDGTDSDILKTDGAGNLTWGTYDTLSINSGDISLAGYLQDDANTEFFNPFGVFVRGDYAYIAGGYDDGFQIVDISDPNNPEPLGRLVDGGSTYLNDAWDVFVNGDYAYVTAAGDDALEIIDVSDPHSPTHVGSVQSGLLDNTRGVYVSGRYAYVTAEYEDSLVIIDISDPTRPAIVGSLVSGTNLDGAYDVEVQGKYAYVTAYNSNRLAVIDISSPTNPQLISTLVDEAGATELSGPRGINVIGKYAYIAAFDDDALAIVDISSSTNPVEVGTLIDGGSALLNGADDVKVAGDYAFIASYYDDAVIVADISSSTNPTYVTRYQSSSYANEANTIFVENGYIYTLSNSNNYLTILNIPTFKAPTAEIGDLAADNFTVYNDAFFNDDVYINHSLMASDLYGEAVNAFNVYATGSVYASGTVVSSDYWARNIDASNPSSDTINQLAYVDAGSCYGGSALEGDYYYNVCGSNSNRFQILDVSDPSNPELIYNDTPLSTGYTYSLRVQGNYAYTGDDDGDFEIIDISNPPFTCCHGFLKYERWHVLS